MRQRVRSLLDVLNPEQYEAILALLLSAYIAAAFRAAVASLFLGLAAVVWMTAALAAGRTARQRIMVWVALALVTAISVLDAQIAGSPDDAAFSNLITTGVYLLAAFAIITRIVARAQSGRNAIAAAACVYLFIGFGFAHLYVAHEALAADPFLASGEALTLDSARYFSFTTLTTLGFGDLAPVGTGARSLVMLEAISGQFFIAVAVARLVGSMQHPPAPGPPSSPSRGR